MLKYDIFDDHGKARSQCPGTGMTPVCYANYLPIAIFIQLCVKSTRIMGEGTLWDDTIYCKNKCLFINCN
ncbi:hypothetical protein IHO40_01140 [Wolbachia endosymbiont of Mansonella ozzardi]|uniref:hypothetical protein n=1 Tax=Wolbachia endosymbiont of Mansonella ozzardi TaxID=137464 RepID=UPI001CE0EAAD|nr:hypothetical protein [Wolbachia endosymbiont of Mansonella ozzardi]MCA4774777.1 hypothetical protein [Wolbachia endosymbiont of Mansonella ozzardi]